MIVLGIETSCDETAAAVVRADAAPENRILSDLVLSQLGEHAPYGGVVPEIAARAHVLHLDGLVRRAMDEAGIGFADLDAVAATAGPGLLSGLLVGLMTGKAIAAAAGKPFLAVNHLEGHALSARLVADVRFPFLLLLVSGGHCQLLSVEDVGRYVRLGTTLDDAAGEAFDKTAKLLGLGFPGGAAIERLAQGGDRRRFALPRPMLGQPGCDFSFSGLKTAVRHALAALGHPPTATEAADLAASFQTAAVASLADRVGHATTWYAHRHPNALRLVVAGGVAANGALKAELAALSRARGFALFVPPARLCTDNGAMIAWAGAERLGRGMVDGLDAGARARWPLDPDAEPKPYAGVKA